MNGNSREFTLSILDVSDRLNTVVGDFWTLLRQPPEVRRSKLDDFFISPGEIVLEPSILTPLGIIYSRYEIVRVRESTEIKGVLRFYRAVGRDGERQKFYQIEFDSWGQTELASLCSSLNDHQGNPDGFRRAWIETLILSLFESLERV